MLASTELEARISRLETCLGQYAARDDITHLLNTYWKLLDLAMSDPSIFGKWAQLNCEDVVFNHPGSQMVGLENAVAWGKSMTIDMNFVAGFHLVGNLEISVDGDRAHARNNLWGAHVRKGKDGPDLKNWFAEGGYYTWEFRKESNNKTDEFGGWRISRNELHVTFILGEGQPL